jgi:hypothetical protein
MFVSDEQQGFGGSGSKQWVLAAFIDFSSSGDSQSPLSASALIECHNELLDRLICNFLEV